MGFESACKHNSEGLERVHQLTTFIKKRQAIEEDYAKALSNNSHQSCLRKALQGRVLGPDEEELVWSG